MKGNVSLNVSIKANWPVRAAYLWARGVPGVQRSRKLFLALLTMFGVTLSRSFQFPVPWFPCLK